MNFNCFKNSLNSIKQGEDINKLKMLNSIVKDLKKKSTYL